MTKQDELQEYYANTYINGKDLKTCYNISVRFGKSRLGLLIMQKLDIRNVLILYPFDDIRKSWEDEFVKLVYKPENIVFSTYLSLEKHIDKYDLIIGDEINKCSNHKLGILKELLDINNRFLGLSGTYSIQTKQELWDICGLKITREYSTEEAINAEIISNYEIFVKNYQLDSKTQYLKILKTKQYFITERKELNLLSNRILNASGNWLKFTRIARMQWINKCNSLKKKTLECIKELKNERFLLYGADTNFVDSLGIPTYHSKNRENNNLDKFINQEINQLGLVQLAAQGVTFPNLSHIIICNINSNSENLFQKLARSLLLDGNQHSKIYIICSNEDFQINWLNKALVDVPNNKIKYV